MASTREELRVMVRSSVSGRTDLDTVIDNGLDFALEAISEYHPWTELLLESDVDIQIETLTFTDGTWTESTKTLTKTAAFADYTYAAGDEIVISGGANATTGRYVVASNPTDNTITLEISIGAAADGDSDIEATQIGQERFVIVPSGYQKVLGATLVDGTSSYSLKRKTKKWVENLFPAVEEHSSADPIYYYEEGGRLYLAPVSSSEYTIEIETYTTLSLASGDAAEISSTGFNRLLVAFATAYTFESLEHGQKSADRWWGNLNPRSSRGSFGFYPWMRKKKESQVDQPAVILKPDIGKPRIRRDIDEYDDPFADYGRQEEY